MPSRTIQLKTQSGSVYQLDYDEEGHGGTWSRLEHSPDSTAVRSSTGRFLDHYPLRVGSHAIIVCPPFAEGRGNREIITSPIIQIIQGDGIEVLDGEKHTQVRSSGGAPESTS